jgi:hypothetical protein
MKKSMIAVLGMMFALFAAPLVYAEEAAEPADEATTSQDEAPAEPAGEAAAE